MHSEQTLLDIIHLQSAIVRRGFDLTEVMDTAVQGVLGLVNAEGAVIELADDTSMIYRAVAGTANRSLGLRIPRIGSLSGRTMDEGVPAICQDSEVDPRVDREACRLVGLRSMILIPLLHGSKPVGVLKAYSARPHRFSDSDVEVLTLISEMVGSIIHFATSQDHQDLLYKATHDYLTGVFNRSEFMDRLRREITLNQTKPKGKHRDFGIIIADMDGLKQVNDTHGHLAGDALIREFAHRCQSVLSKSDTLARLGGDEFAFLLSPLGSPRDMMAVLGDLRRVLEPPVIWQDLELGLSTSFGASRFPRDGEQISELLEATDFRMYRRKRGKGGEPR